MANQKGNNGFFQQFWQNLSGSGTRLLTGLQRNAGLQSTAPYQRVVSPATQVTEETALQVSAVYAAVRLYTDTISTLPLNAFRKKADGTRELVREHWAIELLETPNQYMDMGDLFTQMVYSLVLNGNSYSVLKRVGDKVRGILPVQPSQMLVYLDDDGTLRYRYTHDGTVDELTRNDVIHVKLVGNGVIGASPIQFHAGTIGTAQALDKLVNDLYQSGGKASGILTIDQVLTDVQRDAIKANFADIANSPSSRLQVLEAGMTFQPVSLSPQDMDLIASRKYTVSDIGRIFSIPSVLLDNSDSGWNSGMQAVIENWYKTGLNPILTKLERAINAALLKDTEERNEIELEFIVDGLLRADPQTRFECYLKAFQAGIYTINEMRELEGMPSVEYGNEVRAAVNVLPISENRVLGQHNLQQSNEIRTNENQTK